MTVKMDLSLIIYEFVVNIILSHCIQTNYIPIFDASYKYISFISSLPYSSIPYITFHCSFVV